MTDGESKYRIRIGLIHQDEVPPFRGEGDESMANHRIPEDYPAAELFLADRSVHGEALDDIFLQHSVAQRRNWVPRSDFTR